MYGMCLEKCALNLKSVGLTILELLYTYIFIHQKVANTKERKRQTTCIQKEKTL